jgi:Asp-tRNA(Asn)/Glu-tRNA(Gln) amidotransferase A subunit family amidase
MTAPTGETRRRFLAHFAGMGVGSTLLPGVLWGQMQQSGADEVTREMLRGALAVAGLDFDEEQEEEMLQGVNRSLARYEALREISVPNDVSPPFHFSPLVPGMTVDRAAHPFRMSSPVVSRPANLEEVAFWPVTHLGQLLRTRQVTSVELTRMYLERLHRYNGSLNCVVTFLDELALQQARQADQEMAAGQIRGPLHGIPWGAKDIIAVKGHPTTWGSDAFKGQVFDYDSSIVEMLRDAGAVLVAKLTTGELAQGDRWHGGQTLNPWNLEEGSSGSSAGPASATAAGLVGFALGTETSGSILSPAARCGVTGLRPTLGRVTRHGAMALSWTQDRIGPMCRSVEDCALVMSVISRPDGLDMSVHELPFNWDSERDPRGFRVGIIREAFAEVQDPILQRFDREALDALEGLGLDLVDVEVPEFTTDLSPIGVESAVFFDELVRTGRDQEMTNPGRASGWRSSRVVPAVEYLQHQRIRMMMMMELARATEHVDVWVVPRSAGSAPGGGGAGGGGASRPPSAMQRHSSMANLATYPAISLPHGFMPSGSPAALNFYARPFGETPLLTVARAWQEATDFHRRRPSLVG